MLLQFKPYFSYGLFKHRLILGDWWIISFITAVVGANFVSVTADGRGRTVNGVIINENILKMIKPRENLVIAYTGIKEACEDVLATCRANLEKDGFNAITREINERLNNEDHKGTKWSFIVAGRNEQNINQLSTISNYERNTDEIAIGDEMRIAHSGSEKINNNNTGFISIHNNYLESLSFCPSRMVLDSFVLSFPLFPIDASSFIPPTGKKPILTFAVPRNPAFFPRVDCCPAVSDS